MQSEEHKLIDGTIATALGFVPPELDSEFVNYFREMLARTQQQAIHAPEAMLRVRWKALAGVTNDYLVDHVGSEWYEQIIGAIIAGARRSQFADILLLPDTPPAPKRSWLSDVFRTLLAALLLLLGRKAAR